MCCSGPLVMLTCSDPAVLLFFTLRSNFWGFQYCTEQFMPFSKDGVRDM